MVLLILFGFVAGAGTAVSPCVLPVLPIALTAGVTGGRRRPLGIVAGLVASFTFSTVALVYLISALGLPDNLLRDVAIVVLAAFGLVLIVPALAARVEGWVGRAVPRVAPAGGARADGFWPGVLVGASLGLVYAPCAGPILAGVITVSASQSFSVGRVLVALAYGAGSAVVLYLLMLGGRRVTAPLARRSGALQAAMGVVMVTVAALMLARLDIRFENAIAQHAPAVLVDPTRDLEASSSVSGALRDLRGRPGGVARAAAAHGAGAGGGGGGGGATPAGPGVPPLPDLGVAPDFTGTQRWFNTPGGRALSLAGLRGHVVLVDFWTYSCINCIRTLPYLRAWYARYHPAGLEIVGVHTPEFAFEHDAGNVASAIADDGIRYPVAQDNEQATWNAYGNQYWPAEYYLDATGHVRYAHFGEGDYATDEQVIRTLLAQAGHRAPASMATVRGAITPSEQATPESYLGADKAQRFVNGSLAPGRHDFGARVVPPPSGLDYSGRWEVFGERAVARGGALTLSFTARNVYLVAGGGGPHEVRVLVDGRPARAGTAGSDVHGGVLRVGSQRLYGVVSLPANGSHVLTLEPAPGTPVYSFTFG